MVQGSEPDVRGTDPHHATFPMQIANRFRAPWKHWI